jgi:hypothetical protein
MFLFQFAAVVYYIESSVVLLEVEEASQWSFLLRIWPFWVLGFGAIFVLPAAASILSFVALRGEYRWNLALVAVVITFGAIAFVELQRLRLRVRRQPRVKDK